MKIAILTYHRALNCGAVLQSYALQTVLKAMGHSIEFPQCNHVGESPRWRSFNFKSVSMKKKIRNLIGIPLLNLFSIGIEDKKRNSFSRFRMKNLCEADCSPCDFEKIYDCLIVGSDQVWNPNCAGHEDAPLFLLENFSFSNPIIAYSVSCGDAQLSNGICTRIQETANRCSAVSVREPLVNTFLKGDYPVVPDPTLLLTRADYQKFVIPIKPRKRKLLYCFTLKASPFVVSTARALAKRLNADCVIQPTYQFSRLDAPRGLTYDLSPNEMINQIFNADYVITSSFHGTVFAVHSGKPFLSLREQVDTLESRPASLLRQLNMSKRLVNPTISLDEMVRLLKEPIPQELNKRLGEFRAVGINFLSKALDKGKKSEDI